MTALIVGVSPDDKILPVDAAAPSPGARFLIGEECVLLIGAHRPSPGSARTLWDVMRGVAGTTPTAHASGTTLVRYHPDAPAGVGSHPDASGHEAMGLAAQDALDAHAASPHGGGGGDHPDLAAHDTLGLATQAELDAVGAAKANTSHAHVDSDIPASVARDTEVTAAVDAHVAAVDPHAGYLLEAAHTEAGHTAMAGLATQAELDAHAATNHGGAHPDLAAHDTLGLATQSELDTVAGAKANTAHSHVTGDLPAELLTTTEGDAAYAGLAHGHGQLHDRQHATDSATDHTFPGGTTNFLRADGTWAAPPSGGGGGEAFPVGSIFLSAVATNPATLLGYGTWEAFAAGRVLVGIDAAQAEFDTALETGGAKSHTLTEAELPAHSHPVTDPEHSHVENQNSATTGSLAGWGARDTSTNTPIATSYSTQPAATGVSVGSAGGGAAHNNLQPYIVVHIWRRTA